MAYTVKSGDNWFSIAQKELGDQRFAARLRDRNRGVTLSPGVRIKTTGIDVSRIGGGAALATFAGISPTGVAPTPGAVIPVAGVPGITPAGERPPAELAPQAQMVGPEQLVAPTEEPTFGEPITVAGLAAGIGPLPPTAPFYPGIAQPEGGIDLAQALAPPQVTPAEYPPFYPGIPRPELEPTLAPTLAQPTQPTPFYPGVGWGRPGETGFQPGAPQLEPTAVQPGAEYVIPTPSAQDTAPMPTGQYVSGRVAIAQAATWTARALSYAVEQNNRNYMPEVITSPVATLILSSTDIETFAGENITSLNGLFADDALSYTEIEPGVWAKNPEVTYTGGYTGAIGYGGRRYGRGRGTRGGGGGGAGGVQYGPRLTQWRIAGFG